jgi:hypothetical protein
MIKQARWPTWHGSSIPHYAKARSHAPVFGNVPRREIDSSRGENTLEVFYGILVWVGLGIAVITALIAAWRSAHGVLISTVGLLIATGAWITAKAAEAYDYHDADGWADCWPSCSAVQRSVGTGPTRWSSNDRRVRRCSSSCATPSPLADRDV